MKRGNLAIIILASVAIVACLLFSYQTEDSPDRDDRLAEVPQLLSRDDIGQMTAEEGREYWNGVLDGFVELMLSGPLTYEQVSREYSELERASERMELNMLLADWDFHRDPVANGDEYLAWSSMVPGITSEKLAAIAAAMEGPNAEHIGEVSGPGSLSAQASADPAVLEAREQAFIVECLAEDDPDMLAEKYLELVDVRNSIASALGYGSYIEYRYDAFGYSFSPEQVEAFRDSHDAQVRQLYEMAVYLMYSGQAPITEIDPETIPGMLLPVVDGIHPKLGELLSAMMGGSVIDVELLDAKTSGGYCTHKRLSDGTVFAFIYTCPSGRSDDLRYVAHEFGHVADFLLSPGYSSDMSMMEFPSTALEMLAASSDLLPIEGAEAVSVVQLVLTLCNAMVTERFEMLVYTEGAESAEDLEALYIRACEGLGTGSSWYSEQQVFMDPFNMVGYLAPTVGVLGLYMEALSDRGSAEDRFISSLGFDGTYAEAVEVLGLTDAFDPEEAGAVLDVLIFHIEESYDMWY